MVFDSLQPHPVVDPVQTVALAQKTRDKIVIGKVSVESVPAGKETLPQKQTCEKNQTRKFYAQPCSRLSNFHLVKVYPWRNSDSTAEILLRHLLFFSP